jgi:hypothetical protein
LELHNEGMVYVLHDPTFVLDLVDLFVTDNSLLAHHLHREQFFLPFEVDQVHLAEAALS